MHPGPAPELDRLPLRPEALRAALTTGPAPAWRQLEVVESTGSTNHDLAERARAGEAEGLVLAAEHQSTGRGRMTRSWSAPPRSGLAVSVLLRPAGVPERRWAWLSLLAGVALRETLVEQCGLGARLKWPNDVLLPLPGPQGAAADGGEQVWRKVCGILAEAVPSSLGTAVVLGAGLNVSQSEPELPVPTATSLRLAGAVAPDREQLLRRYLRTLSVRYRQWCAAGGDPVRSGLAADYREACLTLGRRVQVQLPRGAPLAGVALGVDDDGRLLVRDDSGADHALAAGDVVHVRPPVAGRPG